ncbi:hypothetical protein P885DRAFT_64626 [Corynascus similis CBS 632.67]
MPVDLEILPPDLAAVIADRVPGVDMVHRIRCANSQCNAIYTKLRIVAPDRVYNCPRCSESTCYGCKMGDRLDSGSSQALVQPPDYWASNAAGPRQEAQLGSSPDACSHDIWDRVENLPGEPFACANGHMVDCLYFWQCSNNQCRREECSDCRDVTPSLEAPTLPPPSPGTAPYAALSRDDHTFRPPFCCQHWDSEEKTASIMPPPPSAPELLDSTESSASEIQRLNQITANWLLSHPMNASDHQDDEHSERSPGRDGSAGPIDAEDPQGAEGYEGVPIL